jgi:hypothetical protein
MPYKQIAAQDREMKTNRPARQAGNVQKQNKQTAAKSLNSLVTRSLDDKP